MFLRMIAQSVRLFREYECLIIIFLVDEGDIPHILTKKRSGDETKASLSHRRPFSPQHTCGEQSGKQSEDRAGAGERSAAGTTVMEIIATVSTGFPSVSYAETI